MKKIKINMLSKADSVEGQGVGSAYLEQVGLLREGASDVFDIVINDKNDADIVHVHSINPNFYFKMKNIDMKQEESQNEENNRCL